MQLKKELVAFLAKKKIEIIDYNPFLNEGQLYPDIAVEVCKYILNHEADRGILICGTGIGMSISANKVPGIRAAVCHDIYSAERAEKSNDAQIICLGANIIGLELAKLLLDTWLKSNFMGGPSLPKVERINNYDEEFRNKKY